MHQRVINMRLSSCRNFLPHRNAEVELQHQAQARAKLEDVKSVKLFIGPVPDFGCHEVFAPCIQPEFDTDEHFLDKLHAGQN